MAPHTAEYNARRRALYAQAKALNLSVAERRFERHAVHRADPWRYISGDPLSKFKQFSSRYKGFPASLKAWAIRQNRATNRDDTASFGYRFLYHRWIDETPEPEAIRDSEGVKT